jgi:hypothetical protein
MIASTDSQSALVNKPDIQDCREVEGVRFVNPFSVGASLPP